MPKIFIAILIFLSSISFSYSQNIEVFKFTDEELSNLKVRKVRGAKNMTEYSILTEDGENILKAKVENCQIIWITTDIFKSEHKIYGELLLRKNENRTNLIKNNFLNKIGKKLSKSFSTNIRLRSFSIKDEFINAAQIKLGEDDDG